MHILITSRTTDHLRPPDLLEPPSSEESHADQPVSHRLGPYSSHVHPSPVYSTALSPYYTLASPETTLILTSPSSLPIRLLSPFAPGILATYPLVDPFTEKWIAPHSILFSSPYSGHVTNTDEFIPANSLHFIAGSQNQISFFDVSRDGSGPTTTLATAPGNRKARRGGSLAMAGIVSCLSMSCDSILAAGTFSRGVGLYDAHGMGDTIGTWSLKDSEEGAGVTSIQWSRCGRYLVVAERGSNGMGLWDIRGTGQRLAWLNGRNAITMQRLGIALGNDWHGSHGQEHVYAGGTDGYVQVWNALGQKEGQLESDWCWKAHGDAVTGIGIHSCGSVVATCSGSRHDGNSEQVSDDRSPSKSENGATCSRLGEGHGTAIDNSIQVWGLEDITTANNERMI